MAIENHFTIQEELEDADFYPLGNGESVDNAVGSSLYSKNSSCPWTALNFRGIVSRILGLKGPVTLQCSIQKLLAKFGLFE